ncbi:MAG: major capsid protein [Planctomycetota bacterium]|nr:major capsid protein [Planctomycetota bacterium]
MDGTVRQILDPRLLTASYQQLPGDVATPFTDVFYHDPEEVDDNTVRSMYDPADMAAAPGNQPGAEARVVTIGNASERVFNLFYSFNRTRLPEDIMKAIREPASYQLQKKGATEIGRVLAKFRARQIRFKELVIAKILTKGVVYMNALGQVLESSTGAAQTADFQVPAANQGNAGGLVTGLFSTVGTDIPAILESIVDQALTNNVPAPRHLWMNKSNLSSLRNNTKFQTWAANNEGPASQILRGQMIEDLWGWTWHFVQSKYENSSGSMTPYIPATGVGSVVLTPDPTGPWVKATTGLNLIPKTLDLATTVDAALASIDQVYGAFAYAALNHNPISIDAFLGDKFGLHFNEPGAVWQLTAF